MDILHIADGYHYCLVPYSSPQTRDIALVSLNGRIYAVRKDFDINDHQILASPYWG